MSIHVSEGALNSDMAEKWSRLESCKISSAADGLITSHRRASSCKSASDLGNVGKQQLQVLELYCCGQNGFGKDFVALLPAFLNEVAVISKVMNEISCSWTAALTATSSANCGYRRYWGNIMIDLGNNRATGNKLDVSTE
jgi:hypothetical protein